jgi:hypothetical protein
MISDHEKKIKIWNVYADVIDDDGGRNWSNDNLLAENNIKLAIHQIDKKWCESILSLGSFKKSHKKGSTI